MVLIQRCVTGAHHIVACCRLQTECAHYRSVSDEAYRLLTDVRGRDILSQSLASQLCDWLDLVEEVCSLFHFFVCIFFKRIISLLSEWHTVLCRICAAKFSVFN